MYRSVGYKIIVIAIVYCVYIVVTYFVFAKHKFNNDFRGATKHDYFLVLSFYKDTLSNICQKEISKLNKKN